MKLVSQYTESGNLKSYHTRNDCPNIPENTREITDSDVRRGMTECRWCRQKNNPDVSMNPYDIASNQNASD